MFKEIFSSDLKNRAAAVLLQRLQDADCILWGLGRSLNKQKPGISEKRKCLVLFLCIYEGIACQFHFPCLFSSPNANICLNLSVESIASL